MLIFHIDVNMKLLGIHLKNDSFKWGGGVVVMN